MAALLRAPVMRTPSPKIRIHRSQSFGSPSSRMSVTPIDDSPYSKSTSAIGLKPRLLPQINIMNASNNARIIMNTRLNTSDDSLMFDSESDSSTPSSPTNSEASSRSEDGGRYGLFSNSSPPPLRPTSPRRRHPRSQHQYDPQAAIFIPADDVPPPTALPSATSTVACQPIQQYQDPTTPMFDPRLVRLVLSLYDERGLDWMDIAEVVSRGWGVRTGSAEVLSILSGNGRVGREWWD